MKACKLEIANSKMQAATLSIAEQAKITRVGLVERLVFLSALVEF